MNRRQRVIASVAKKSHSDVNVRDPALELVVPGAMHPVRRANRGRGSRKFNRGKGSGVIHGRIVQEPFGAATRAEISRRRPVQSSRRGNSREQPPVLRIPEAVRSSRRFL